MSRFDWSPYISECVRDTILALFSACSVKLLRSLPCAGVEVGVDAKDDAGADAGAEENGLSKGSKGMKLAGVEGLGFLDFGFRDFSFRSLEISVTFELAGGGGGAGGVAMGSKKLVGTVAVLVPLSNSVVDRPLFLNGPEESGFLRRSSATLLPAVATAVFTFSIPRLPTRSSICSTCICICIFLFLVLVLFVLVPTPIMSKSPSSPTLRSESSPSSLLILSS